MKKLLVALFLAACGGAPKVDDATSGTSARDVSIGSPAPAFSVIASDGEKIDSEALKGKPIVVYFYPKDETSGCTTEACAFRDAWDKLQKSGVVLIGVSVDDDESHRAFAAHHKLPFHLVSDPKMELAKKFGVSTKYIEKLGATIENRETIVIKDGKILKVYRNVDPAKHVEEIEADLGVGTTAYDCGSGVMADDIDERAHARVGTVLDEKWKLERLLGIGGMAAVYAGLHRNGARAAIKVLHHTYARRPDVRDRFLREGYAANRVTHSGVVKVLDDDIIQGGLDDGGAFLVMELLEGESVEDRLDRGPPISEAEMLAILRAVLDVLEVAHKEGIIHRDLKPENLFLASDRENPGAPPKIKILDFGLARIADLGGKTIVGLAIGTPSYMPPEQATGRVLQIDNRSDLFALGATAFRVLAGRTVHPGEDATAICARMASEPAPKLQSVATQVSSATAAVIDRALAFESRDRWPDAAAMRTAVNKAIDSLGAEPIAIESGMIEVSIQPLRESSRVLEIAKKKRRSSWFVRLLIVILAAVAGKLGYDRYGKSLIARFRARAPATTPAMDKPDVDAGIADAGPADARADARQDAGSTRIHPTMTRDR